MRPRNHSPLALSVAVVACTLCAMGAAESPTQWKAHAKVIHRFQGSPTDASGSNELLLAPDGNLYESSFDGGLQDRGAVYELSPKPDGEWSANVLYSFQNNGVDGLNPSGPLLMDNSGNLFGTTDFGGSGDACTFQQYGCGTVFELSPHSDGTWAETILYNFHTGDNYHDGIYPASGIIFDRSGNLYGTTVYGGNDDSCLQGCGTVFELAHTAPGVWTEQILYNFQLSISDGNSPWSRLVFGKNGKLYGTTAYGGLSGCDEATCGTAFELAQDQKTGEWSESILHFFGGPDGASPYAGMTFDRAGNLFGTTSFGGTRGTGAVFELSPQAGGGWAESVIANGGARGSLGNAPVVIDGRGNVYGTATWGGRMLPECIQMQGCGSIFQLHPTNSGWVKRAFEIRGTRNGYSPLTALTLDPQGRIFGTTDVGGSDECNGYGCGTVFELTQ